MTDEKKEVELTMIDKETNSKTLITLNQVKEYKFHKYELRTNIINQIQSTNTALPVASTSVAKRSVNVCASS